MIIKIKRSDIFAISLFFMLFEPRIFENHVFLDSVFKATKMMVGVYLIITIILKMKKITSFACIWIIYRLIALASTTLNYGYITKEWIITTVNVLSVVFLIDVLVFQHGIKKTCVYSYVFLSILHTCNLFTILLNPNGIQDGLFLLGGRTAFQYSGIPFLGVALLVSIIKTNRIWSKYSLYACAIFTTEVVVHWTSTSILGIGLIIVLTITFQGIGWQKHIVGLSVGALLVNYLVVVHHIQEYFMTFFQTVLRRTMHRSITLSGRTYIWEVALIKILQRPFLGYGENNSGLIDSEGYQQYFGGAYMQGHNLMVQLLYNIGFIGTAVFILAIVLIIYKIFKYQKSKYAIVSAAVLLAFQIMSITEIFTYHNYIYLLFALFYHVDKLALENHMGE